MSLERTDEVLLRPAATVEGAGVRPGRPWASAGWRVWGFVLFLAALAAGYDRWLPDLIRVSRSETLYSHLPLIPFVALYLAWLRRGSIRQAPLGTSWFGAVPLAVALAGWGALARAKGNGGFSVIDEVALEVFLVWCAVGGGLLLFLGVGVFRAALLPFVFLLLAAPFPEAVRHWIEAGFQYASAEAAGALLQVSGASVYRDGLVFHLPEIALEVGEECSGIRSSLVLFITSLVAGQMFLERPWARAVLACIVVPLGIVRNGIRILTIALLCVQVGPEMVHSAVHTRGGPLFFGLSMIPFFGALWGLRRIECARASRCARRGEHMHES